MAEPGGQDRSEITPEPPEKSQKPHRIKSAARRGVATAAGLATLAAGAVGIGIAARPDHGNERGFDRPPAAVTTDLLLQNDEANLWGPIETSGYLQFVGITEGSRYEGIWKDGNYLGARPVETNVMYALFDHPVDKSEVPQTVEDLYTAAEQRKVVLVVNALKKGYPLSDKDAKTIEESARQTEGWVDIKGTMGRYLSESLAKDNPPPADHAEVIRRSFASILVPGLEKAGEIKRIPPPVKS